MKETTVGDMFEKYVNACNHCFCLWRSRGKNEKLHLCMHSHAYKLGTRKIRLTTKTVLARDYATHFKILLLVAAPELVVRVTTLGRAVS